LKKFLGQIPRLYKKLDVSPISPGGFSKELIIIFWGLNAILFLADSVTIDSGYEYSTSYDISCTVVKEISSADYYTEHTEIIKDRGFILISSYNFVLPEFDFTNLTRDRSPPEKI